MSKRNTQGQDPDRPEATVKQTGTPTASQGKLFPPTSEVDVPVMPKKVDQQATSPDGDLSRTSPEPARNPEPNAGPAGVSTEAAGDGNRPAKIDTTKDNWADSTQPAPDKRTARSSIL